MLQYDFSHQAVVMMAVNNFVDYQLNDGFNQTDFIVHLCVLIPAFQVFDQEGSEYSTSIDAFKNIVQSVETRRGDVGIEEYLTQLSSIEISNLRNLLRSHRSQHLAGIRLFKQQEEENQDRFLAYMQRILNDHYKVLIVRIDLGYLKASMSNITVQDFYNHIESMRHLLKDKNGCFKHLLTFGLALEHGATKGFHAHLMLVYNSSKIQKDVYYGFEVINKWREIAMTNGGCTGIGFNVNWDKKKYQEKGTLGVGEISRDSAVQHANALRVAEYLVRPEKYSQMMLIKLGVKNTFTKGKYKPHGRMYQTHYKQKQLGCNAINLAAED